MCDTDVETSDVAENPNPEADAAVVLDDDDDELNRSDDVEADIRGVDTEDDTVEDHNQPQLFDNAEALLHLDQQYEPPAAAALFEPEQQLNRLPENIAEGHQIWPDLMLAGNPCSGDNSDDVHVVSLLASGSESVANAAPEDEILGHPIRDVGERTEDYEPECDQAIAKCDEDDDDSDNVLLACESVNRDDDIIDNMPQPALPHPDRDANELGGACFPQEEFDDIQPLNSENHERNQDNNDDATASEQHPVSSEQLASSADNDSCQPVTPNVTSDGLGTDLQSLSSTINNSENKADGTGASGSGLPTTQSLVTAAMGGVLLPLNRNTDMHSSSGEIPNDTVSIASNRLELSHSPLLTVQQQQSPEHSSSAGHHSLDDLEIGFDASSLAGVNYITGSETTAVNKTAAVVTADHSQEHSNSSSISSCNNSNNNFPNQMLALGPNTTTTEGSTDTVSIDTTLPMKTSTETVEQTSDPHHSLPNMSGEHHNGREDQLLNELEAELQSPQLTPSHGALSLNGMTKVDLNQLPEFVELNRRLQSMKKELAAKEDQIQKLESQTDSFFEQFEVIKMERNSYRKELDTCRESDLYLPQIKALEDSLVQKDSEIRAIKEKLSSHEASAKRAIANLQTEHKTKLDQVTKMAEDCKYEKESMVMKYAQAEQKGLDMQKTADKLEARFRESVKEKESLHGKLNSLKAERQKYIARLESKSADFHSLQREYEKQKELASSCENRMKWTQNKLTAEVDSHKETKLTLQVVNSKLKESKEECEQIRQDCQDIIKTYQESEEIKSNSLDNQLKAKENELKCHELERNDHLQIYQIVLKELESLKSQHKDILEELKTKKDKVTFLEDECRDKENTLSKFKDVLQNQKSRIKELKTQLKGLEDIKGDYDRSQQQLSDMQKELSNQVHLDNDTKADIDECKVRESELLELTANLSAKNAQLQSENITVNNKVLSLEEESATNRIRLGEFETKCHELDESLVDEKQKRQEETTTLTAQLHDKSKAVEELGMQLEEEKDDIRTLKRKHANNIKDLTRQLTHARRKLESHENTGEKDSTSLGSRTSSNGSLNTLDNNMQTSVIHRNGNQDQEYPVITEQVEVDKQVLIERIVKLQKSHARKSDKIEFMEDHINHLVNEIQKKKRIIQSYALREEAGVLSPDYMDMNKAILSRKGGIMASLYHSQSVDQSLTLDLSLEINKKLQAVLEDTLLKNITLKDSLDTLGKEIARLSQENRKLQLEHQNNK